MARFNTPSSHVRGAGPLATSVTATGTTHEGGAGFARSTESELFLHATTQFVGEDTFYTKGDANANRLRELVASLAVTPEGWTWLQGFLPWLRTEANVRTAGILLAAEAVKARLDAGLHGEGNRELIAAVLQRADEPGEVLAYWTSRYGKAIPKPIKRGVADAAARLYTERGFLRYDSDAKGYRFGDVLELTHPTFAKDYQKDLFRWAITARHGRDEQPPESLTGVHGRYVLSRMDAGERHVFARAAGSDHVNIQPAMAGQWEWLMSWLGEQPKKGALSKAEQWKLAIPHMGYMALLRNLRNFDEADVEDKDIAPILAKFTDPAEVAQSRQLPFRFYSAYKAAPSLRWGHALDVALTQSLVNVPELDGRSLILIDTSGSMEGSMSAKGQMTRVEAAALFGLALALKNPGKVDVFGFATGEFRYRVRPGGSLLSELKEFCRHVGVVGHGTDIHGAVMRQFSAKDVSANARRGEAEKLHHDRVFIFSDMQTMGGYYGGNYDQVVPKNVPIYGFNLAGYSHAAMPVTPGNNRHEMGGLTDATFRLIPQIEAGQRAAWPWQK